MAFDTVTRAAPIAAVLLCSASLGSAQAPAPGKLQTRGAGAVSCGNWLANRTSPDQNLHFSQLQWVLGWLSAASQYNVQGDLRDTDPDAVTSWVDKYCREHPLDPIRNAAFVLVNELSKPQ